MSGLSVGSAWADGSAGTTTAQAGTASNPAATPEAPSDAAETPAKATPAGTDESNHDADESEEADEDTDALSAAQVDPATITSVQPKGSRRSESHPDTADTATTPGAASRVSKADAASDVSSADDADTAAMTAAVADTIDMAQSPAISPLRVASTRSASLAVSSAEPSLAAITPAARETGPVDVVSRLVSGVVNAILSPFAVNSTRDQSAGVPLVWSLLAFARREFDAVFTPHSTRETTIDPVTTSETEPRTLILSAFPAEADAVLARTTLDPNPTVVVDGHHFYLGSIGGKKVIVAMTGIGMQNATQTTEVALDHFTAASGISIGAVVFSGVAGGSGRTEIGSVAVPARWTSDDGATWHAVDPDMLAAANGLTVDLESLAPLGDPFCSCNPLARLPLVDLKREPQMFVGGDGSSDDNNNGMAFPAIPFGGDIFGPQPCTAPDRSLLSTGNFLQAIVPFLANSLLSNLTGLLMPQAPAVDAVDQETAAAQQVAEAHGIPFLGIRGMSDGPGDPLGLPGYPFTFVAYRQLAADNAANVTEAFLQSWDGPR